MPEPDAGSLDPVILIHGAWQGSWAWDLFVPHLAEAGLDAQAIDLPGNGADGRDPADVTFADYIAHLEGVVAGLDRRVSLVAHSGASGLAIAFAERWPEQVARIVHIAGIMLPDGSRFADLVAAASVDHPEAVGISPHLQWSADRKVSVVPPEAAIAIFLQDCPEDVARAAATKLTPHPEAARAAVTPTTPGRYGRVPSLYVEATQDRSIVLPVQRLMQARVPGLPVVSLPTGHAPQVAAPALLAEAIVPFLRGEGVV
jgi:pimeloyl-ACP methyl ester carboxylesterase